MRKLFVVVLALTAILVLVHALAAAPEDILIDTVQTALDEPTLTVYFTVVDENGQPDPTARVESVELEIWDENGRAADTPATVEASEPPLYVALAVQSNLDSDLLAALKDSLRKLVEEDREGAMIMLVAFAPAPAIVEPLTDNPNRLVQAVDRIRHDNGRTTCLYDAVRFAREELNKKLRENPAARTALLLVADGSDNLDNTCATSLAHVTDQNDDLSGRIPVFTLAPAEAVANSAVLDELADETRGLMSEVNPADLSGTYEVIANRLKSQWVATATLQTDSGAKDGILLVTLENQSRPLPAPIPPFTLQGGAPQLPSQFRLDSLRRIAPAAYTLAVEISHAQAGSQLFVTLWDEGNIVRRELIRPLEIEEASLQGHVTQEIPLFYPFEGEQEYRLEIEAQLADGTPILTTEGEARLTHVFTHPAATVSPPVARFQPLVLDEEGRRLLVTLAHEGAQPASRGQLVLVHSENNVQLFAQQVEQPQGVVTATIPLQGLRTGPYLLTYELYDAQDQLLGEPTTYTFSYNAPSIFRRTGRALREQWGISLLIALLVVAPLGVWLRNRRRQPENPFAWAMASGSVRPSPTAGALNLSPATVGPAPAAESSKRQPVVAAPPRIRLSQLDAAQVEIASKEFIVAGSITIGRDDSDFELQAEPNALRQISRQDILLTVRNGILYITDKSRRKATYVDGRKLPPGKAQPIHHYPAVVLLGESLAAVKVERLDA